MAEAGADQPPSGETEDAAREAEIAARLALVRARYGPAYAGAPETALRKQISAGLTRAAALRRVPLDNADEPAPAFAPFRAEDEA